MAQHLIINARVIAPTVTYPCGWLLYNERQILALGGGTAPRPDNTEIIDAQGLTLLPGFVDVHVHGAMGYEAMDATTEALQAMSRFYAQHGTTGYLPTTWTDTYERTFAAVEQITAQLGQQPDGATILGVHLEGPYLNAKMCGAQNRQYIRRADRAEVAAWLDFGTTRLLALAPEYEENLWLIEECARRGIMVSAAHTAATYQQIKHAVSLGLAQTTHTYNAMTGLHHREPGVVGAAMTLRELTCELIADNIHVHPASMQALYLAKGADHIVLISDAIRGVGMPEGDYMIDERVITIKDGAPRLPDGTLSGTVLTMDRALYNFMQATGEPLDKIWKVSSLNAARQIGVSHQTGSLEIGKHADLVLVDDEITIQRTIAQGRTVYQAMN